MAANRFRKWEDILTFSAIVLLAVLINQHTDRFFFRWDLTEEKRYSLSDATENILKNLEGDVFIEVYLEGDLNAEFKRLQASIRETLDEFSIRSNGKVSYKFTNPNTATSAQGQQRFYQQLAQKGIPQTTLFETTPEGENIQKAIFPGAMVSYNGKEEGVLLLKGNQGISSLMRINQSIEGVEFELINTVVKLSQTNKKRIAFVQGHDELTPKETIDISRTLSESYLVDWVNLHNPELNNYDALIIAQPKKPFSDLDKFYLDQYVMQGGNAMLLIDRIQVNTDSIPQGGTYAFGYDLNMEDLIFRYGVRINIDLLQDQQAGMLELVTGNFGNQANIKPVPWLYYVYMNKFSNHPIVRNMDVVYGKYLSSLDTVKAKGIRKTPLIFSSQYSRVKPMPSLVSLDEVKDVKDQTKLNKSFLPMAYLLEGSFKSLYANRYAPKGARTQQVIKKSQSSKLIVMADGDIIRNEIDRRTGKALPIDFDRFRQKSLSNKEFILNSLSYLTDENGLINARNKTVTMRPLDKFKIRDEKLFWQILNIVVPALLVIAFGIIRFYWRKRKFEKL